MAKRNTIVVGVDYSDIGTLALQKAFELAKGDTDANLHVVSVLDRRRIEAGDDIEKPAALDGAAESLKDYVSDQVRLLAAGGPPGFTRVVTHVAVGDPAEEIIQLATDLEADLVVVGTHGRKGLKRLLLGSVAEGVMRLAQCPALVVRPIDYSAVDRPPQIEPPCPRCVAAREASDGKELWCSQHSERHGRRHTYHMSERAAAFPSDHPGLSSIS